MTRDLRRICVFCGSSSGNRPLYGEMARSVGKALADRGVTLVYGGGSVGLMGEVADAALNAGGQVIGVIPRGLSAREIAHQHLTEMHLVETMHERKALMADLSDGFVALPGAYGTLDEFLEILTWAQLGIHHRPCGMLNVAGYFDSLLAMLDRAVVEGFLDPRNRGLILIEQAIEPLLDRMQNYTSPVNVRWMDRAER